MTASSRADDELIGQTIAGRHRIISRLGVGGMGVAYRAWDEQAGVPVVIKIPKPIFLEDPKFAERFRREIRLLQGLSHPHIVPIVDVGEHEGLPYVAMRFLPGGSLSNRRLRDEHGKVKPNPPGMLHLWMPAVAEALDFVHAQGVVHRDVKPANIFFDAFWGAYLGDFGIAKIVGESEAFDKEQTLTATNMGIGTQEYMSPEQFTPRAVIDGRSDQYALAVMAYEMLSATRPFAGATMNLIVEVMTQPVPPLQSRRHDLPSSLVNAVHRGLARQRDGRFPTCKEFASAALRDVPPLDDDPGVARLLCPKCSNILKLPAAAAGQKGSCPKCSTQMKVADDLGALWLLDEARRQRKARQADAAGENADEGTASVTVGEEDVGHFKPVSSTTPIEKATRARLSMRPLAMVAGAAAAALVIVALVAASRVRSQTEDAQPVGEKQPFAPPPKRPPTYEERLAAAEARLAQDPQDPPANETVGSHHCFRERNWAKGLPCLARGTTQGLISAAKKELAAAAASPSNAGEWIRAAKSWWQVATRQAGLSPEAAESIKKHAADIYTAHVGSLQAGADAAFASKWLDDDPTFRDAVGNKRPPPTPPPPQPYRPLPLDKVATAVSTRGMFYSPDHAVERLIFRDWGPKNFRGVPFALVDPRGASVKNVVMLHGPQGYLPPRMPKAVSLPVGEPAKAVHLLSGVAGWGFPAIRDRSTSMIVRLVYVDGRTEDHGLVNGEHIADYIRRVEVPKSEFAFDLDGRQVRYLRIAPARAEPIASVDFVKGNDATSPLVMAVTVERP